MASTTRAAVWLGEDRLELREMELPPVGDADVAIRIEGCGLCGSDLHVLQGEAPGFVPPRILGHEPAGVVTEVGSSVHNLEPDDRVTWEPSLPCGGCFYCRDGEDGLCERRVVSPGAFADCTIVPAKAVHRLSSGTSPTSAVLAEPLACALHALDRSRFRIGDHVAIAGAGTIGCLIAMLVRRGGAKSITVSDPNPRKRALVSSLGADEAIDPNEVDFRDAVVNRTDGRGADVAFEAVGAPASVEGAMRVVRPGGSVALVGLSPPAAVIELPLLDLQMRDLTLSAVWMRKFTFQRAVALLDKLPLERLVTHTVPLADIHRGIELLRDGEATKVMVAP